MSAGYKLQVSENKNLLNTEILPSHSLVSVIIPCYNQGVFLGEAIKSAQKQNYSKIEIIVVDDGSTDETKTVAQQYDGVHYFFQENQGLSAARNKGIKESHGAYLVFLDADDLLLNDAISYNFQQLQTHRDAAFVSGAYDVISIDKKILSDKAESVNSDHYLHLLKSNYIGMHATVMYRRNIFNQFQFDTFLGACEDYDLYLKVARHHPVIHHTKKLAAYRMHGANMSGNIPLMLDTSLEVLQRQKSFLKTDMEKRAMKEGMSGYQNYFISLLFSHIQTQRERPSQKALDTLKKYRPALYRQVRIKQLLFRNKNVKKLIPEAILQAFHKIGLYKGYQPSAGNIRWGDLKRTIPFSKSFGFDRGGAIDRYYIENFLLAKSIFIKGRVLEIGDNDYTLRFGKTMVNQSDILHVDNTNPKATIIGDLSNSPQIRDESFDCIILTQTLHLVYDYKSVIHTCYRILKPGGVLLLTVPGITPIDYGEWGENWLWSFTERAILKILSESFASTDLEVQTLGNVGIASAFLYGMGLPEVTKEFLDFSDPHFPVVITAQAVKKITHEGV